MKRRAALLAVLFAAPALAGVPASAQVLDRSRPIPLGPARPLNIPDVVSSTMPNGMRLAAIEMERMGLAAVKLVFPYAGNAGDPAGKDGVANVLAILMLKGAGPRTASDLTIALLGAGAGISVDVTRDFMVVTVSATKDKLDEALAIAADVVRRPTLPQAVLDREKREWTASVKAAKTRPSHWAGRRYAELIYGDHPYGRPVTEESLAAIDRGDLRAFHAGRVVPQDAVIGASGISLPTLERLAAKHFGDWATPAGFDAQAIAAAVPKLDPEAAGPLMPGPSWSIDLFDEPSNDQAELTLAFRTIAEGDPDYDAFDMAIAVLGRGSLGRLYANLRKDKQWSYGAYGDFSPNAKAGTVAFNAEVQEDKAGPAIREILSEILKLRTTPVPDEELEVMKQFRYGAFVRGKQSVQALAGSAAFITLDGDPADYIAKYRDRLFAVTPAQLQNAARKYLVYDTIHIIVVADAAAVYDQLSSIGSVRVVDGNGREIKGYGRSPALKKTGA